jgi:hypothetical protein
MLGKLKTLMNKTLRPYSLFVLAIFLLIFIFPNICHADAISPIINVFTPDTAIPASILTVLIILIEALLLWKWIKPVSFRLSLWRSAIINVASSAAGSVVVLVFFRDKLEWGMSGLIILMFFILTLAIETPLLKILYRNLGDSLSWVRTAKISFGINLISYLFVLIFPFILLFAYSIYGSIADSMHIKKWTDISLLNNESGYIYTLDHNDSGKNMKYVLEQYDVEKRTWKRIEPASGWEKGIRSSAWDVRGNIIACIIEPEDWTSPQLSILNTASYTPIFKINGNFKEIRISPDMKKLAAIEHVREAIAPKDKESYFSIGSACKLRIYDINSGKLIYEAPRWALNEGLSWGKDSTTVFFTSFRDEHLFDNNRNNFPQTHSYGRGYAKEGQFPIDIFVFDLATNPTKTISKGMDPRIVSSTGDITFVRERGMYDREIWKFDFNTGKPSQLIGDVKSNYHAVSPSGRKFLIQIPHHHVFGEDSFLTVIDTDKASKRRFILRSSSHYDFRWVPKTN